MDFINSLVEVKKNQKNFKKWEENQHDEEAKREELSKRRQHTEEQKAAAKAYGEKIIDIVDIMDNHSENVSENVETASAPLASLITMVTSLGGMFYINKKYSSPLINKIENIRKNYVESDKAKDLVNRIREFHQNIPEAKNDLKYFWNWDLLSENHIKKIKDADLKKEAMDGLKKIKSEMKPLRNKILFANLGVMGATIASFIGATILQAKLQTDASKVARFQARKELEDEKNFVMYTPEQIAAAKEELKKHPEKLKEKEKTNLKSGMFKSIYNVIKDKRAYSKDRKAREDNSQKVERELSPQELIDAQKDKEVIQRVVRIINNEAEKNSENMEVAANVIMGTTPILGATVGAGVAWILNKAGVIEKFVKSAVEQNGSAETKKLFEEFKAVKEGGPGYTKKWSKFVHSFMEDSDAKNKAAEKVGETVKEVKTKSKPTKDAMGKIFKKLSAIAMSHKYGRNGATSVIGGIITGFAGLMIGLKLQKSAARAGRYNAKRDLEKNPENFIGYTQEEYDEVKDVKNNKKKTNPIKEYALFIPNVMKQYWAYNKYKKHEYKEKQALNDILKKQEVTDEQLKDAKNLQRKLFNTFEKVDDNSQVYSESMEAACEIAQPFVWYGGIAAAVSPFAIGAYQLYKHPAKYTNKLIGKISSTSDLMNKKWFKNYLKDVADNIPHKIEGMDVKHKPLAHVLKNINLKEDSAIEILGKFAENVSSTEYLRKMDNWEQYRELEKIKEKLNSQLTKNNIPENFIKPVNNLLNELAVYGRYRNNKEINMVEYRADIIDYLFNPKVFEKIPQERQQNVMDFINNLPKEDAIFHSTIREVLSIAKSLKNINSAKAIEQKQAITKFISEKMFYANENGMINLSEQDIKLFEMLRGEKYDLSKIMPNTKDTTLPDKIKEINIQVDKATFKMLLDDIATRLTTRKIKDFIPASIKDPKAQISKLKAHIEGMNKEEFEEFAESIHFSSMDKKTMLEILPKVEKIIDNIPKEEAQKIFDVLVKEFNEHPDEFIQFVTSTKVRQMFMTPKLEKALAAAGISWTVFTVAMTYAVEAWMADMQLKAGRLGVMKAMEGLEDPAYYANVEPTHSANQTAQSNTPASDAISKNQNLLDRFKK